MKKILAILTSAVIYGKERSNIEVYNLIKDKTDYNLKVVVNKHANNNLKAAMSDVNLCPIITPTRQKGKFRILRFIFTYLIGNIQLATILIKYRPDKLFMCSELNFYDFYPALLLHKGDIVYRIGDAPGVFHGLAMKAYNSYVWKNYIMKRITRVVCISKYIMNCFADEGRDMTNDVIIYNYPPTRKHITKDESSLYLNPTSDSLVFGYIGQLTKDKGVHHYIQAALQILKTKHNTLFYIAGSTKYDEEYSKYIFGLVPNDYCNNIIFLNEISNIELFFNHIDVLCVPSIKQEPLGNVIVEAKQYSKPCIIYPTGGMPELITDGEDGFICNAPDSNSLLEQMKNYIDNKQLSLIQGKMAHESILKKGLDRDSYEKKWLKVINE